MDRAVYRIIRGPNKGTIGTFAKLIADKDKVVLSILNIGNNVEYEVDPKDVEIINYVPPLA